MVSLRRVFLCPARSVPTSIKVLFRDRHGPGEDGHLLNLSLRLSAKGGLILGLKRSDEAD